MNGEPSVAPVMQNEELKTVKAPSDKGSGQDGLSEPVRIRSGHLNLGTSSIVNQNGSFAFDRELKAGKVKKRTRKTKVSALRSP